MVLLEQVNVFNFRADRLSLRRVGLLSNRWLVVAWLSTLLAHVLAVHLPLLQSALHVTDLDPVAWFVLFAIAVPLLAVGETVKGVSRQRSPGPRTLDATAGLGEPRSTDANENLEQQ
jgi:Ca2+-transporting ATPase